MGGLYVPDSAAAIVANPGIVPFAPDKSEWAVSAGAERPFSLVVGPDRMQRPAFGSPPGPYSSTRPRMAEIVTTWTEVPKTPAIYAMYGGEPPRNWVAYVGDAGNLHRRLIQHFVNRDSSVVTGTSAAGLNIDYVRFVDWWEASAFSDEDSRRAAELVAFDVLNPALRSRGSPRQAARELYADADFNAAMTRLFTGEAVGRLVLPRLPDVFERLSELEKRVFQLERLLRDKRSR